MRVTGKIPDAMIHAWGSQVSQYDAHGEPGITHERHTVEGSPIECLLHRDAGGRLTGILNYYPQDIVPYEAAGNFFLVVHPDHKREGIGSALVLEMVGRWGPINWQQQLYSDSGATLINTLLSLGVIE